MTEEKQKSIMEKIEKLLALGESKVNQNEAQSAMKRAHELMQQYAIDEAKTLKAKSNKQYEVICEDYTAPRGGLLWETLILSSLAPVFDCEICFFRTKTGSRKSVAKIVGTRSDLKTFRLMADYALGVANRLTSERYAKVKSGEVALRPGEESKSHLHSFRLGVTNAFGQTLKRLLEEKQKEVRKESETGLIVVEKEKKVSQRYKELFPNAVPKKVSSKSKGSAFGDGVREGSKVGFNKQVADQPKGLLGGGKK